MFGGTFFFGPKTFQKKSPRLYKKSSPMERAKTPSCSFIGQDFFVLITVVHEKKNRKKTEKTKSFFIFDGKSLFLFSTRGKKRKKFLFFVFFVFFFYQKPFSCQMDQKKSVCFDLKISLLLYDWSIDA